MSIEAVTADRAFADYRRPVRITRDWLVQRVIARLTSRLPPVKGNVDGSPEIFLGF